MSGARTAEERLEEAQEVARAVVAFFEGHPERPMDTLPNDHPIRQMRRITPPQAPEEPVRAGDVCDVDRTLRTATKNERAEAVIIICAARKRAVGIIPRRRMAGGTSR